LSRSSTSGRARWLGLLGSAALLAAGCGSSRNSVVNLSNPLPPRGFKAITFHSAAVALRVPRNWTLIHGAPPILATVTSGRAFVTLWRYSRTQPPPALGSGLQQAQAGLIAAARRADPTFKLIRAGTLTVDNLEAIELDAFENVNGQRRRVRSTHVYAPSAEYVLDAYAPPDGFHAIDHTVFSPIKRSLRVLGVGTA
jgi:hypothetical protein